MNKLTDSRWFTRILALFFALLLFFNANSDTTHFKFTTEAALTAVAENVPVRLKYDEKKYYVASYEATTTVYMTSANKVLLDIESDESTRMFKVEADLTEFSEGTYEVPLEIINLNKGIEGTLKDKTLHVRIEKRESRQFDVTPKVNDNLLKKGYSLENIVLEPAAVEITSGQNTLDAIDQVVASLDDDRDLSSDLSKRVDVVALDKDGNILSVIIVPTTVSMTVHVEAPSKAVPLTIKQSGAIPTGIKSFQFETEYENITIRGSRENIDKIEEVTLFIDTTAILAEKKEVFKLDIPDTVEAEPQSVEVSITPIKAEATKTSSTAAKVKESSEKK
ncbi:YbbR-like domain-containing protein [Vagococcus salmoninarum]|uniref:CdaR family protein n=1 Tax=Vagococcus salmoninarum TaxID=2739 RepID=UPI00187DFD6E|nr:CdaR family protein [Vagococcus salmoninarum]MBE9389203.1 hypothetical protein [Vagococcus salmoninarum]